MRAIYFYTGRVGADGKQNAFLKKLEQLGYIVKAKEVKGLKFPRAPTNGKAILTWSLLLMFLEI